MARYKKKPVEVEAQQWWRNGDHPLDYTENNDGQNSPEYRRREGWEGEIVRYFRHPDVPGDKVCKYCGNIMHDHGWIDTMEGGHIVCPSDYIITGVHGEHYPCKVAIFDATYDRV